MALVVQKYGGSSLATLEMVKKVARKVIDRQSAGDDVVVVASAMGDTTDKLIEEFVDPLTELPDLR